MNIEEIREEIKESFMEWDTLSQKMTCKGLGFNKEWPDFPVIGIYVLGLVGAAYDAGIGENGRKLYEKGFEDAAKDPSTWYVMDENGEQIHIGDTVKTIHGDKFKVECLGNDALTTWNKSGTVQDSYQASALEKVIKETRENAKESIAYSLIGISDSVAPMPYECALVVAEQIISRIEALGD